MKYHLQHPWDDTKALDYLKTIKIDPPVKAAAAEQDHFERFHNNNTRFKNISGIYRYG